jgi:ATP-dependent RNA helicase HelY
MKLHMPEMPPGVLLSALASYDLLPAIVFMPTRRRCDQAASEAALLRREDNEHRRDERRDFMRSFVEQHPEVRGHRHWDTIVRGGVASHHAGHIPAWKLVIENLMSSGLLDAIFATATVAAGVDFPARSVVLTVADARSANGWRQLSASELQQMTGRAGRRGRDNVGFVVVAPGLHQDPTRIAELLRAQPDPLVSQFRATYTSLLNLLDAYENFAQVREIAERSFAHREAAVHITRLEESQREIEKRIERALKDAGCQLSLAVVRGFERLISARSRLYELQPQTRAEVLSRWLDEVVQPGRVVGIGRSGRRLVFVTEKRDGSVRGIREDGRSAAFALNRIGRVYSQVYRRGEAFIDEAFDEVRTRGRELVMHEPRLRGARDEEADAIRFFDEQLENILPASLTAAEKARCTEALWSTLTDAEELQLSSRRIEGLREEVWQPFQQRARVLAEFGYLDYEVEKVTDRGRWLADLRIDRPLLVGEGLKHEVLNSLEFERMAAIIAALTADEDRDYGQLELPDSLVTALAQFEDLAFKIASVEWRFGIEPAPELNFSAAAATAAWATGTDWPTLVRQTGAEEGDLFRMLSRTGEALLQIAGLRKTHATAAAIAAVAADAVLREPVR